ncbi:hypothetical protein KKC1_15900 [Calderihabitans maritimus]|uniref:Uncharacterized protein n=1 Tax=Calderihabitans maritimus TaxID=1246530 RepID=A0A1Z5HSD1_9FIRM|nr:hypothetical protein KKC1_15900 [Calderihabitans maritimus]
MAARQDEMYQILKVQEEGQKILKEKQETMAARQDEMYQILKGQEEEQKILKEKQEIMAARQDEMYQILRAWEEDRPVTKKAVDELQVEVARMKNHKHKIVLQTEVETVAAEG